ncbi:MAG: S8 family serine peptidase [Gaiellaceae bacterium]
MGQAAGRRGPSTAADEARGNVLWGDGERRLALVAAVASLLVLALLGGRVDGADASPKDAYLSPGLMAEAEAAPNTLFGVIVQARKGKRTDDVVDEIQRVTKETPAKGVALGRKFISINGASATLTGRQILRLAKRSDVESITRDSEVELTSYSSAQTWTEAAGVTTSWLTLPTWLDYPTIAVVDSGVTPSLPSFGSRVVASVNLRSSGGTWGAYGHGSMVASIAAGSAAGYTGAEPRANLVSIKVLDGAGMGSKSDIIAACDWILRYRNTYNIRVANFSLNAGGESFRYDALDRAVEALWLNGVTVVVAAGNFAVDGQRSDIGYAPANDPFVITVGASDIGGTAERWNDTAAPWSAWGYTQDGFFKPELAAPGRYMVGAFPSGANLASQYPQRVVAPGYMWMSGTSFAAPVVSGIAASLLAKNPSWTPDQVKGALMATTSVPSGYSSKGALGVGVVNAAAALGSRGRANPNAGLNQFVTWNSATRRYQFDAPAWHEVAMADASWADASWADASWADASWSSASWADASWSSASWADASWSSASWANASWANSTDVE